MPKNKLIFGVRHYSDHHDIEVKVSLIYDKEGNKKYYQLVWWHNVGCQRLHKNTIILYKYRSEVQLTDHFYCNLDKRILYERRRLFSIEDDF